jgi:hypothetical protein
VEPDYLWSFVFDSQADARVEQEDAAYKASIYALPNRTIERAPWRT